MPAKPDKQTRHRPQWSITVKPATRSMAEHCTRMDPELRSQGAVVDQAVADLHAKLLLRNHRPVDVLKAADGWHVVRWTGGRGLETVETHPTRSEAVRRRDALNAPVLDPSDLIY